MDAKKLIISQISEQLESNKITGIKEMFVLIPKDSNKADIIVRNICDKTEKVVYDIDRKNILIKIFLNKFAKYAKKKEIEVSSYTIKIDLKAEKISAYIKDLNGQLHTIDF